MNRVNPLIIPNVKLTSYLEQSQYYVKHRPFQYKKIVIVNIYKEKFHNLLYLVINYYQGIEGKL